MQFSKLDSVINEFPPDMQIPTRHLTEWIMENQGISREDFTELKLALQDLTVAQSHTEEKVQNLAEGQERLSEAQERTEQSLQRLEKAQECTEQSLQRLEKAQECTEQSLQRLEKAQERTEQSLQRLEKAQERTEQKVQRLAEGQERLSEAQERTDQSLQRLAESQERTERTMADQIAALGSRWGIYNEVTFRSTIRGLLEHMEDISVEEGFYGGRQVDVIIRNGEHIMLEITSRMNSKDIDKIYRSADDYRDKTGTDPKLMVATTYIPPSVMRKIMGLERPIDLFTYDSEE